MTPDPGIIIVSGSHGRIGDAVTRRLAGRFQDVMSIGMWTQPGGGGVGALQSKPKTSSNQCVVHEFLDAETGELAGYPDACCPANGRSVAVQVRSPSRRAPRGGRGWCGARPARPRQRGRHPGAPGHPIRRSTNDVDVRHFAAGDRGPQRRTRWLSVTSTRPDMVNTRRSQSQKTRQGSHRRYQSQNSRMTQRTPARQRSSTNRRSPDQHAWRRPQSSQHRSVRSSLTGGCAAVRSVNDGALRASGIGSFP